jgi:hypothetical protein
MINFNEITILKKLGAGMLGTVYLVKYNNDNYALKIQKIIEDVKIQNYRYSLWREIDFYNYINSLNSSEQLFFSKLYDYRIINNCKHIQIRPKDTKKIYLSNNSDICSELLIEYKGNTTLLEYLSKKSLKIPQIYSIIIQICNIGYIAYKGGYSHNDMDNFNNIMINPTKLINFNFFNKIIPLNGIILSAIDYGSVFHKKFIKDYNNYTELIDELFIKNSEKYLFNELYDLIIRILLNKKKYIKLKCKNRSENGFKMIIDKHHDFYINAKNKYLKIYPKLIYLFNYIEKNLHISFYHIFKNKNKEIIDSFNIILFRIIDEFHIFHPKLYIKYFYYESYYKLNLPKEDILDIMKFTNINDLFNYLINRILNL